MTAQVVMQFQLQDSGWSEVHYNATSDLSTLIDNTGQMTAELTLLTVARKGLMPFTALLANQAIGGNTNLGQFRSLDATTYFNPRLLRVRCSLVAPGNNFRRVRTFSFQGNAQFGTWQGPTVGGIAQGDKTAEPWSRLECACSLQNNNNGHIYLGAVPESQIDPPDTFVVSGGYQAKLNAFFNVLTSGAANQAWQTRLRTYVFDPLTPVFPITSFVVQPSGSTVTMIAPGLVPGPAAQTGQLIIRGRHPSQWNGVHRYQYNPLAIGGPTFTLGPSRQILADFSLSPGNVQLQVPQFVTYVSIAAERLDHRDNGSPFARPRGRRKRPA